MPIGALALLVACTAGAPPGYVAAPPARVDFEGPPPPGAPNFGTTVSGDWQIVRDPAAPAGAATLAQLATSPEKAFNLWFAALPPLQDGAVAVAWKALAGELDQGGGLVFRAVDAGDYYLCRMNPLERNCRLFAVVAGERRLLASADFDAAPGWHRMEVTCAGDQLTGAIDGRVLFSVRDATFAAAGRVGLWTKADARTRFDDLRCAAWRRSEVR